MLSLPIICSGGIGDTLLKISSIPIKQLGSFGFRFNIFYEGKNHPAWKILEDFLLGIEYCQLVNRMPSRTEYRIRNIWSRINSYLSFNFTPPLKDFDYECQNATNAKGILFQTHLDGHHGHAHLSAKVWPIERWCELFLKLHEDGWDINILEYNDDALKTIGIQCPFVHDVRRKTLLEQMKDIQAACLVVSVDSWTKYAASWWNIPQIVVVPDLRKGYTPFFKNITPDDLAKIWFRGLTKSENICLLGLEKIKRKFCYTLPTIDDLSVSKFYEQINLFTKRKSYLQPMQKYGAFNK